MFVSSSSSSIPLLVVILTEVSLVSSVCEFSSVIYNHHHLHSIGNRRANNALGLDGRWNDGGYYAEIQPVNEVKRPLASLVGVIRRGRSSTSKRTGYFNSIPRGGGSGGYFAAMTDDESEESGDDYDSESEIDESDDTVEVDVITDDYDSDSENDESDVTEVEVEVDIITDPNGSYAASASAAKPMNDYEPVGMSEDDRGQQCQSYMVASGLWSALALDVLRNKEKRLLLFPQAVSKVAEGVGGGVASAIEGSTAAATIAATAATKSTRITNVLPTTHLTSGFILAAGIALLLSRKPPSNLYDVGNSSSIFPTGVRIRQRLHLLLSFFSIANLGAHLNSFAVAPFLGGTAAAIHGHNALIGLNAWRKETRAAEGKGGLSSVETAPTNLLQEFVQGTKTTAASLVGTKGAVSKGDRRNEAIGLITPGKNWSGMVYTLASQLLFLRGCRVLLGSLVPHYVACLSVVTFASASVEQLRLISLEWASFARLMTSSIVFLTLKEEAQCGRMGTLVTRSLNGIVALCTLAITIPPLLLRTNDTLPLTRIVIASVCGYNAMRRKNAM